MARRRRRKRRAADYWEAVEEDPEESVAGQLDEIFSGTLALELLVEDLRDFPTAAVQRGDRYAAQGRVRDIESEGLGFSATVRGTYEYELVWNFDGECWTSSCACPVGICCKHAVAAAIVVLKSSLPTLSLESRRNFAGLLSGGAAVPPVFGASSTTLPNLSAADVAARAMEAIRESKLTSLRRSGVADLLRGTPVSQHISYEVSDELNEADPDMRCWRLARAIASRADGWVPDQLRTYLEREDLAAQMAERRQRNARKRLAKWLDEERPAPTRTFRAIMNLERDNRGITPFVSVRVTSARLDDAARSIEQVTQAWAQVRRDDQSIAPEQYALLDWVVAGTEHGYGSSIPATTAMLRSLDHFERYELLTWHEDIDAELARRAGITPGGPVRFSNDLLRLEPECTSESDEALLRLALLWPDGHSRALRECLLLNTYSGPYGELERVVCVDGIIHRLRSELPGQLVADFEELDELRVASSERRSLLGRLAHRFPSVEVDLAKHTRFHDVSPIVALDLREDDWLQLRLYAAVSNLDWSPGQSTSDGPVFEYAYSSGWVRMASDPKEPTGEYGPVDRAEDSTDDEATPPPDLPDEAQLREEEIWDEAPKPQQVAPAIEWMHSFDVHPGNRGRKPCPWEDHDTGWWVLARRKGMERFADAWAAAPPGVRFYGTPAVRRLLDRGRRVVPRVKVAASGLDWFEVSAAWEAEGLQLTEDDIATLRKATNNFVRLSSGWVRRDLADEHAEMSSVLADLGIEAGQEPLRLSVAAMAGAKDETLEALGSFGCDADTMAEVGRLREQVKSFQGIPRVPVPRRFRGKLRPYQRDGLDFLSYAAKLNYGVILADDMGLGKTVQALAWLQKLRDADPEAGPSLVVCPASVAHNWSDEAEQFAPKLRVLALASGPERKELMARVSEYDIVVTNYALLRRDIDVWGEHRLRALILDEAQNIKNPDAVVTRAVRSLSAKHRIALTGTPIENRVLDLWSIAECVNQGYLGTRSDFVSRFDSAETPPHRRTLLASRLRPILLRRTKTEVAPELPERIEETRRCAMKPGQRKLYLAELSRSRTLVDDLGDGDESLRRNKITILAALTRLRQICCHPVLAGGKTSLGSGKFDTFFDLLEPLLEEGHKVLVFSQFVENLKLLRAEMDTRTIRHHMLTGQTKARKNVVSAFTADADPCVFLISLKAGGSGLNLTSASYVVLFGPWWNPAVEAQAIDRTHRIGQDRTVIAYRLITEGTIEEKILELQRRKEGMVRDILAEKSFARALTREDVDYLLQAP